MSGWGSITALQSLKPEQGTSPYIATNVISITDGQIFLQDSLFENAIRPAIDAGSSLSWWICSNQGYEEVAGTLRIDLLPLP